MKICICICICICILRSLNCERIGTAVSSPKLGLLWRWYPAVNHEVEKNAMGWCLLLWNYMPPFQDSKRQQFTWHHRHVGMANPTAACLQHACRFGMLMPRGRIHAPRGWELRPKAFSTVWDQENPWFFSPEWGIDGIGTMGNMGT